jgi:hypothetical protein
VPFPTLRIGERWFFGRAPYEDLAAAAVDAGAARADAAITIDEAFARFERLAAAEIQALCRIPEPVAYAELWRRATEWLVRPLQAGPGGWLFERV